MARMSVDDKAGRDPRISHLAKLQGWSIRETRGCLAFEVWPLCYDLASPYLRRLDLELATGSETLAQNMIAAGLATETRHGLRIAGASERVEYLLRAKEAGRRGGKAPKKPRTKNEPLRVPPQNPQGSRNPPDPVSALVPDLDLDPVSDPPPDPVAVPDRGGARVIDLFDFGNPAPSAPPSKPKRGAVQLELPDQWEPNDQHREMADKLDVVWFTEAAKFRDHHTAKGSRFKDWDAAFRTWLRNAAEFGARGHGGGAKSVTAALVAIANGERT